MIALAAATCASQESETPQGSETSALRHVESIQLPGSVNKVGPVIEEGKGVVRWNATRHGIRFLLRASRKLGFR